MLDLEQPGDIQKHAAGDDRWQGSSPAVQHAEVAEVIVGGVAPMPLRPGTTRHMAEGIDMGARVHAAENELGDDP